MDITATLIWPDYLVIALMISISVGIGIYYRLTGGKQRTSEEYFSANKSMGVVTVAIGLMISFMSAITLLGVSAENYVSGSQFVVINFSYLLGTPLVCYGFWPVFYKLQAVSVYEYLEKRFGTYTRLLASLILWIQILLYSGVVLYAPALAFEATTGFPRIRSILICGLACAFYSSIGGIKAVLITDIFQAVLMFVCLILVIVTGTTLAGGLDNVWEIAQKGGRIEFDNISTDPTERHTWWSLTFGGLITFLSLYAVNQVQVQRMMTVRSLKAARTAMWISLPILGALSFATCFSGLVIYSKYYDCDPIKVHKMSSDSIMPYFVMDTMASKPGLPGLFIAGIFSAGLSTISAALNSLAAVTIEDYLKPLYRRFTGREIGPSQVLVCGKVIAFVLGLVSIAVAVLAQYFHGILQTSLTIFGIVGGPLLGLFTLGMLFESATQKGAVTGAIVSFSLLLWVAFGGPRPKPQGLPTSIAGCLSNVTVTPLSTVPVASYFYLYRISYLWYAPIGFLITVFLSLAVSHLLFLLKLDNPQNTDPDLFFPCIAARIKKRQAPKSGVSEGSLLSTNASHNVGKFERSNDDEFTSI